MTGASCFVAHTNHGRIRRDTVVPLEGADASSFVVLGHGYAKDGRHAWFEGVLFAVRDAASLRAIDSVYALDRQRVYFHQAEIPGSDPASFVPLDERYSKDAARVYHGRVEPAQGAPLIRVSAIAGADPALFRLRTDAIDAGVDAEDAKVRYREGSRIAPLTAGSATAHPSLSPAPESWNAAHT